MSTTSESSSSTYTLVYWPVRGLGQAIRAALTYNEINFNDNRQVDWFQEGGSKDRLEKILPIVNLPTLILPNGKDAITQTGSILRYINSIGKETRARSDLDAANIDMVVSHLLEFHQERLKMIYGEGAAENIPSCFAVSIPFYYGKLEEMIAQKGETEFVATDYLTVADIFLAEQIAGFVKLKGGSLEWLIKDAKAPRLAKIYEKVVSHEKLMAFYEKEKDTPFNNLKIAAWH